MVVIPRVYYGRSGLEAASFTLPLALALSPSTKQSMDALSRLFRVKNSKN